jgi:hypothetical protein
MVGAMGPPSQPSPSGPFPGGPVAYATTCLLGPQRRRRTGPPLCSEPEGQPFMRCGKATLIRHLTSHRYDRQIDAWGRSSMSEGVTGNRHGILANPDRPRLASKGFRRAGSGLLPSLRRILLVLALAGGLVSVTQGQARAAQARTGGAKVLIGARGDLAPALGQSSSGYWLVGSDGGIYAFGDAHFDGSTAGIALAHPIVGIAATPDGKGYWLVASDGGIYAFGDAHFDGSTAGIALAHPIVGIAATGLNNGPAPGDDIDGHHDLAGVSCPTNGWCMAVDASGNAINYSGGAWGAPVLVDPGSTDHADLGFGEFDAVSCPTTRFCMAVSNLDGYSIYNGAGWSTIQWPPLGIGNSFHAVSCASATFCDAEVDNFGDQAQWDRGTWTETTEDKNLDVRIGQGPSSVSCAPSSNAEYCVYVDNYNNYAVFDNGTWLDRGSKLFAAGYAQAEVSCYAVDRCGAIDDSGVAITYNGSSWSTSKLVDPPVGPAGVPTDLSCVTGFCAAGTIDGKILYENAGSWSAPLAVGHAHITAVSCASSTFCVVVGPSGHALVLNPTA